MLGLGGIATTYILCRSSWRKMHKLMSNSRFLLRELCSEAGSKGENDWKSVTPIHVEWQGLVASNEWWRPPMESLSHAVGCPPPSIACSEKSRATCKQSHTQQILQVAGLLPDLQAWPGALEEGWAQTHQDKRKLGAELAPSAVPWEATRNNKLTPCGQPWSWSTLTRFRQPAKCWYYPWTPPSQVKNGGQDSKGFRECHVGAGAKTIYSYQHQLCQQGH